MYTKEPLIWIPPVCQVNIDGTLTVLFLPDWECVEESLLISGILNHHINKSCCERVYRTQGSIHLK